MVAFIKISRIYLITYNRSLSQKKFNPFLRKFCFLSKKENVDFTYFSITLDKNSHESHLLLLYVPIPTKKDICQIYKFLFSVHTKYAH